jgi:hypothetical protein
LRRRSGFGGELRADDYSMFNFRRTTPAMPRRPVPSKPSVPGSGTGTTVSPLTVVPLTKFVDPPPAMKPLTKTLDKVEPKRLPLVMLNTCVPLAVVTLTVPLLKVQLLPEPLNGPVVIVTVPKLPVRPKLTAVIVEVTVTLPPALMLPETEAAGLPPIIPPVWYSIEFASATVGRASISAAIKTAFLIHPSLGDLQTPPHAPTVKPMPKDQSFVLLVHVNFQKGRIEHAESK